MEIISYYLDINVVEFEYNGRALSFPLVFLFDSAREFIGKRSFDAFSILSI